MAIDPKIIAIHELCNTVKKYRGQTLNPEEFIIEAKSIIRKLSTEEKFFDAAANQWKAHYGAEA